MGKIALDHIKPGMVLADDALAGSNLLLAKGSTISEKHIQIFNAWGLSDVDVEGTSEKEITDNMQAEADPKLIARATKELNSIFLHSDLSDPLMHEIFKLCLMRLVKRYGGKQA